MTAGRNWYQVFLMALTAGWAIYSWMSGSAGETITATFPAWSQGLWYICLILGSVMALFGVALGTVTGLLVEQSGLFILAGICSGYGLAFLAFAGRADPAHVAYSVSLVLVYAVVNLARARQIHKDIASLKRGLRKLAAAPEAT